MPAKKKTTRRNTKKELQKKAATRKMIAFFVGLLLILFALARLGIVGILLYNIVRLFIGTCHYFLLVAYWIIQSIIQTTKAEISQAFSFIS
ncbi:hypothetical protein QK908_14725 [Lactococcus cremoris]